MHFNTVSHKALCVPCTSNGDDLYHIRERICRPLPDPSVSCMI